MFFYTQKILALAVMALVTVLWPVFLVGVAVLAWFSAISLPVMAVIDFAGFVEAGPLLIVGFWLGTLVVGIGSIELLVRSIRALPDIRDAMVDEWRARPKMRYVR